MSGQMKRVGERIKQIRLENRQSQDDIARALNVTQSAVSLYERGERALDLDQLFVLEHILGRSVEYFLGIDIGLTPDEDALLQAYRTMPAELRPAVIRMIKAATAGEK